MSTVNTDNPVSLVGKTAIVTGAGSGIGRASAQIFGRAGARLVLADLSDAVHDTVKSITDAGGEAIAVQIDISVEEEVKNLVKLAVDTYGSLDVFYANAGITGGIPGGFFDATPETWMGVLKVNLIGPFLAVKHAAPIMAAQGGGSIVCTASVAGLRSGAGPAQYSASKAGVINLVQTAAQQLTGSGVRVNAICPGLIRTGMTEPVFNYAEQAGKMERVGQLNPLKRFGNPSEIANTALFLASDAASYINGQAIVVDGGLSSSHPVTKVTGVPLPNAEG